MARSPGFGSHTLQLNAQLNSVSLRLPYSVNLATEYKSLTHYTKGTQSHAEACSHCLYVHGFRFFFTPLAGVLFAFPSRYWFTIGQSGVFSLGGWSPHIRQDTTCPALLIELTACAFVYGAVTPVSRAFPDASTNTHTDSGSGLLPVRSPLLGNLG